MLKGLIVVVALGLIVCGCDSGRQPTDKDKKLIEKISKEGFKGGPGPGQQPPAKEGEAKTEQGPGIRVPKAGEGGEP